MYSCSSQQHKSLIREPSGKQAAWFAGVLFGYFFGQAKK
jgi:hypothetical protein